MPPARATAAALLAGLLLLAAGLKLAYDPAPIRPGEWDGNFYLQVAQHVAAGDGLKTSASIHSRGYRELPHPTVVYPLWPLVLGLTARVADLEWAASVLPELFYLLSLALLYPLAGAVSRGIGPGADAPFERLPGLRIGHLAVLLFAFHPIYFDYASLPYTEPLAFCMGFAALLVCGHTWGARPGLAAATAGVLAGLAYLARYQMAAVALAIPLAYLLAGRFQRRGLVSALAAGLGTALVVLPWWAHLLSFVRFHTIRILFDISAYQETAELLPPDKHVVLPSVGATLLDRAAGVVVAFHPTRADSYVASFGPAVYLVPLALLLLLAGGSRRAPRSEHTDRTVLTASLLSAGLALLPVHLTHWTGPSEWWFYERHGLPMILLLVPALAYLSSFGRGWRALVLAAVLLSVAIQGRGVAGLLAKPAARTVPDPATRALVEWIDGHPTPPISITTQPRYLAVLSQGGFHRVSCQSPAEQTRRLLRYVEPDYLIEYWGERSRCSHLRGLDAELEPVRQFGQGRWQIRVLRPKHR